MYHTKLNNNQTSSQFSVQYVLQFRPLNEYQAVAMFCQCFTNKLSFNYPAECTIMS